VPLVIPEVNPDHLDVLEHQRGLRGWDGAIVTNANCAAIVAVMALAPLHLAFGVRSVFIATMQAVSGAGYPGVPSLDILGNVIPYIRNEEEKMEEETRKLLGTLNNGSVRPAEFAMSAQCNRVAVEDGHTESVYVGLKEKVSPDDILEAWRGFRSVPQDMKLPSAPDPAIVIDRAHDRPQPRFDLDRGAGMAVSVGRLRPCGVLDWKFTVLSHNTIRGAAGAALLNAELLKAQGYLGD
jgi:aspartate-semialdehyde dehydrogenase